jgi:hypothetical protein
MTARSGTPQGVQRLGVATVAGPPPSPSVIHR